MCMCIYIYVRIHIHTYIHTYILHYIETLTDRSRFWLCTKLYLYMDFAGIPLRAVMPSSLLGACPQDSKAAVGDTYPSRNNNC